MAREQRDVLAPLRERRHFHFHLEARSEVVFRFAHGDVRRAADANVRATLARVANTELAACVEEREQLRLHLFRERADLVEHERAPSAAPTMPARSGMPRS